MYDTLVLPGGGMKGFTLLGSLQCCIDNDVLKNVKNFFIFGIIVKLWRFKRVGKFFSKFTHF